jgi:prepilin-type N-terminal cleavage/methylation domain-containing protein
VTAHKVRERTGPGARGFTYRHRAHDRSRPADQGYTLVEAVVAMVIFAIAASVTLGLVVQTTQVAGGNFRRTAAANLATRQIESARSTSALSIPDGLQQSTAVVGGTTYTIKQNANYLASDATTSVCAGSGSTLAYKLVTVTVSWSGMGSIKPVRTDTLKAVGVGSDGLDQTSLGTLALLVTGSAGVPQAGVTVTLTPGGVTRVTGDDGCAVFAGEAAGSYTATASMPGYAGVLGTRTATASSLGVIAATITRGNLVYDTTRSLDVRLDGTPGAYVPTGMPLRLGDSYVPETTYPICTGSPTSPCSSGTPGIVQGLFPAVYTVKVGACTETTPSQLIGVDLRPVSATVPVVTVPVGTVTVGVRTAAGVLLAGRIVTATHASGCTETYSLPSSTAGGSGLVLPYGTWTLSTVDPTTMLAVTASITVSGTSKTPSAVLTVSA